MAFDAASPFSQRQRPVTVFARTDNLDGFLIVWVATFLITLGLLAFGWDLDPGQPGVWAVCATVGVLAYPLYGARWLRFTPERLIVVRPWLVRRVSWDSVGYCAFEVDDPSSVDSTRPSLEPRTGRYLVLWTRRPGRQEGLMLKLLRADPRKLLRADPPASPPPAAPAAATRSERRLSAVLSELHGRGVRLDPFKLVSIAIDELEGDEDGAVSVTAEVEDGEAEDDEDARWDRAVAELGIDPVEHPGPWQALDLVKSRGRGLNRWLDLAMRGDEGELAFRSVSLDEVPCVRALWQRAGSDAAGET